MIEPRSKLAAIRNGLSARLLSYTVSVSTTTMAEATSGQSRTYRSDVQCDQVSRIIAARARSSLDSWENTVFRLALELLETYLRRGGRRPSERSVGPPGHADEQAGQEAPAQCPRMAGSRRRRPFLTQLGPHLPVSNQAAHRLPTLLLG